MKQSLFMMLILASVALPSCTIPQHQSPSPDGNNKAINEAFWQGWQAGVTNAQQVADNPDLNLDSLVLSEQQKFEHRLDSELKAYNK